MVGILLIFIFTVLLAFPGFYIITRKVFPRSSKKMAAWLSVGLTILLLVILSLLMVGAPL